jgi:hypothetical protein
MPTNPSAAWTSQRVLLGVGDGASYLVHFVGDDTELEEYDRVLASLQIDGKTIFQIGVHVPKGTVAKGKSYPVPATTWIKRAYANRVEVVMVGEIDPAADVNYASTRTVEPLPF